MILEITEFLQMSERFRDTYGMRFVGLEDPGNTVYQTYRVPDAEAPYPQDFVIDQDGYVRHWSWEYDPQEIISVISGLVGSTPVPDQDYHQWASKGTDLWLAPATPNPFRPGTELEFRVGKSAAIRLAVYDCRGRLVRTLVNETRQAGDHAATWDGLDHSGRQAASGIYFAKLSEKGAGPTRRLVLLR